MAFQSDGSKHLVFRLMSISIVWSFLIMALLCAPISGAHESGIKSSNRSDSAVAKQQSDCEAITDQANELFWKRDYVGAKKVLAKLSDGICDDSLRARIMVNEAICDAQLDNWNEAQHRAEKALEYMNKQKTGSNMDKADCQAIIARCLFVGDKIKPASVLYKEALDEAVHQLGPWNYDLAPFYEGLAGCCFAQQQYVEAEPLYKRVAELDYLKYGPDDPHLAWSFLSLASVYNKLNRLSDWDTLRKKMFWNFIKQNEDRI